ncbi:hypothetical protein [Kiloniella sp.]|uniref:hypothetical protein n=1 Tax=Kiloniella sp. TaxID=1938587 RepID=UPI003B01781B
MEHQDVLKLPKAAVPLLEVLRQDPGQRWSAKGLARACDCSNNHAHKVLIMLKDKGAAQVVEKQQRVLGGTPTSLFSPTPYGLEANTEIVVKKRKKPGKQDNVPPAPKGQEKERTCLMGGGKFKSEWPGERICDNCKGTPEWKALGYSEHGPVDTSGGQ